MKTLRTKGFTQPVAKQQAGFTIIEVMIVLAIAGLIMVIVFLAVGSLQSSQRDARRKKDLQRFATGVIEYMAGHGGALPQTQIGNPIQDYFSGSSSGSDPYTYNTRIYIGDVATPETIYFASPQRCNGGTMDNGRYSSTRDWAAVIYQEKALPSRSICIDNTGYKAP